MMNLVPYSGTEKYIFISYAHRDSEKVIPVISRLMAEGYRVWFDKGIDPGSEWDENIAEHINGCGYFIAFMSENYLASSNCKDELNYARDLEKDRILVYLEKVVLPSGIAMRTNRLQSIFMYTYENVEDFYVKLFSANNINSCFGRGSNNPGANKKYQNPAEHSKPEPQPRPVYTAPVTEAKPVADTPASNSTQNPAPQPAKKPEDKNNVVGSGLLSWGIAVILYVIGALGDTVVATDILWVAGATFFAYVARDIFKEKAFLKVIANIIFWFAVLSLVIVIFIWIKGLF